MIAVDTSALIEILLDGAEAEACSRVLETESDVRISAGSLAEAMIVSLQRNRADDLDLLKQSLALTVEPVTAARARRVSDAYARWGKGIHPAGLNFGDCFAFALAEELDCPLLFVGNDFSRTDVKRARRG